MRITHPQHTGMQKMKPTKKEYLIKYETVSKLDPKDFQGSEDDMLDALKYAFSSPGFEFLKEQICTK